MPPVDVILPWASVAITVVLIVVGVARGWFRAGSLGPSPERGVVPPLSWIAAGLTLWLADVIVGGIAAQLASRISDDPVTIAGAVGVGGLFGVVGAAALMVHAMPGVALRRRLSFRAGDGAAGAVGAVIAFALVLSVGLVGAQAWELVSGGPIDEIAHDSLRMMREAGSGPTLWIMIFSAVVAAPVAEEIIYRGVLQRGLVGLTRSPWSGVLTTGVVFGLMHLGAVPWHAIPSLIALGWLLGAVCERSGRIGACVVIHALFNASQIGLVFSMGPG